MAAPSRMVTAAEAAVLAGIEVRDVHRIFDEGILPESLLDDGGRRQVVRAAVPLLAFYFQTAGLLHADARRTVIQHIVLGGRTGPLRRVGALGRRRSLPLGDGVTVNLALFVRETDERTRRVEQARVMVVQASDVLGGSEPVIRGTRVPVYDVAASVAAGVPREDILASYPSLTDDQVELAALYASAEPPRGRPRRRTAERLPEGARVVSSGTVARPSVAPPRRPGGSSV